MEKLSVRELEVKGRRVLVRVDFNVPIEEVDGNIRIMDHTPDSRESADHRVSTGKRSETHFARSFRLSEGQTEPEIFAETDSQSLDKDDSAAGRFFDRGDRPEGIRLPSLGFEIAGRMIRTRRGL